MDGQTEVENLALAFGSCSLRKAARIDASDPETGDLAPLFSPRSMTWEDHFRWDGFQVEGLSKTGRATVLALAMNRSIMVSIRQEEALLGRQFR